VVSVNWLSPLGKYVKGKISGGKDSGVHPPKDATGNDAVRTIHFLPTGIDIRDHAGTSSTCRITAKWSMTNPTFSGEGMKAKMKQKGVKDMIMVWEHETGMIFDQTFP